MIRFMPGGRGGGLTGLAESGSLGDLIYADTATTWARLADVAAGAYLRSGGVGAAPVWSTLTLPNAATAGDTFIASAANTMGVVAAAADGNVYRSAGVGVAPVWGKVRLSGVITDITGTLGVADGGTGVTALSDIVGTVNQVTVTGGTARVIGGAVTLSAPQDIHTAATPQFGGLGIGTAGAANRLLLPAGTVALPSLRVGIENSGLAAPTSLFLELAVNGSGILSVDATVTGGALRMRAGTTTLLWTSTNATPSGGTVDTGLGRNAAGVLEINSGTGGIFRDLRLRSINQTGGLRVGVATKTAAYTATADDHVLLADATAGAFTITLPAATTTGLILHIEKIDSSANAVTISRAGTDTIEGATTITLSAQYQSRVLVADGASTWYRQSSL